MQKCKYRATCATCCATKEIMKVTVENKKGLEKSLKVFIDKKTIKVCEEISVTGSKEITDDIQKGEGPKKVLFLLGYSGWAPGQLEDEIMRDSWFVSEKIENLIFCDDYQSKWSNALFLIGIDPSKLSSYAGSS